MIFLIFTLIVALLVAIFAVQNADPVAINLFWYVAEVPLVLVILGSVLAGALIVFLIAIYREFRIKGKAKAKAKAEKIKTEKVIAEKTQEKESEHKTSSEKSSQKSDSDQNNKGVNNP
ncbi:MAG: DUF1049 domain-containing protein [Desulfitobacterium sp.]|nr:DUF1049 domain-containing protein [Desulfitobacterium sp.]